jgi:hypothetical protein
VEALSFIRISLLKAGRSATNRLVRVEHLPYPTQAGISTIGCLHDA